MKNASFLLVLSIFSCGAQGEIGEGTNKIVCDPVATVEQHTAYYIESLGDCGDFQVEEFDITSQHYKDCVYYNKKWSDDLCEVEVVGKCQQSEYYIEFNFKYKFFVEDGITYPDYGYGQMEISDWYDGRECSGEYEVEF